MDLMVYHTQVWLNQTYGNDSRFNRVEENGQTGWPTIYALTRALQIELGIQNTADNFGPTTRQLYSQNPLQRNDGVEDNKFGILQGALWCKGYDPGHYFAEANRFSLVFDEKVEKAVKLLKTDAGISNPDGIVTTNFMAALLSMDSFKLLSAYGGDAHIRQFQQEMNRNYEAYTGIMPCDGVYGRNTNKALIYALQAEEALPIGVANANFGEKTKKHCPTIPYNSVELDYEGYVYTPERISRFLRIFKFGLYVNGFGNGDFGGDINREVTCAFQAQYGLPMTGIADLQTWMSTMVSCGDNTRKGTACDTRFEITEERLANLKANNYSYVGRYLTGGSFKEIRDGELARIFAGGLSVFPIYQTSGTYAGYFSASQGAIDARNAEKAARLHGVPRNTVIYFAVDFDAMDYQITNNIIPHFEAIKNNLNGYQVGIYGARNICSRVAAKGYSVRSFVGDMSTGFSGNLGFPLPADWSFDQISNIYITHNGDSLEIDNDIFSGRDTGFNTLAPYADPDEAYVSAPSVESFGTQGEVFINRSSTNIPVYSDLVDSEIHTGGVTAGGEIIGYIYPDHFYSKAPLVPGGKLTSYGVVIHDDRKGVIRGYIETSLVTEDEEKDWTKYQEAFADYNSTGSDLVLVEKEVINGTEYSIFTATKELDRINRSGDSLERLPAGTHLAVAQSTAGFSYPNFMFFDLEDSDGFWKGVGSHYIDVDGNEVNDGGFIDLGYQFGTSPEVRAIK